MNSVDHVNLFPPYVSSRGGGHVNMRKGGKWFIKHLITRYTSGIYFAVYAARGGAAAGGGHRHRL